MPKSTILLFAAAVLGSTQILHHGNALGEIHCDDSQGPICVDSRVGNPALELGAFDGNDFKCGINAKNPVRCPIGTCCSKWGFCGPTFGPNNPNGNISREKNIELYCNADSSGDWRVVPCDSKFAVQVKCDDLTAVKSSGASSAVEPKVEEEKKCIDKRYGDPTWDVHLTPDGDVCGVRAEGKPYRCPFGMCCSKQGYCGPARAPDGSPILEQDKNLTPSETEDLYCKHNDGDWRYVSCESEHAVFLDGTSPHPVKPKVEEQKQCVDKRYGNPTWEVKYHEDGDLCGIRAKGKPYRCPFGMCCSKHGYCGPARAPDGSAMWQGNFSPFEMEALYCDPNDGDWRYVSCDSEHAVFLDGTSPHAVEPEVEVEEEEKCIDKRYGNPTWKIKYHDDGDLCGIRAKGKPYRCPFGMCCSQEGYCGPARAPDGSPIRQGNLSPFETEERYCNNHDGDWRYVSCDSEHAVYLNGTSPTRS